MTKILRCKCSNKYQDDKYGALMRVHNMLARKQKELVPKWRCTVCLDVKESK